MNTNLPTERSIIARYDPEQAPAISYHREDGVLIITFGPSQTTVEHLLMILRREVEPATSGAVVDSLLDGDTDIARLESDQAEGDRRRGER